MIDGGLRRIFQKHLPEIHWQAVETGSTSRGVPDLNYCFAGREGWIECKFTRGWAYAMRPEQIAWIERRARAGGSVYIAVRRKTTAGPRKGPTVDELYLMPSRCCRATSLKEASALVYTGGPARWHWEDIKQRLISQ